MRTIKKTYFTLLEVLVSMGVFALLMLALMQFFSAAQGVWERTGNKAELFDTAKVAMDLLANDLACAYYEQDYNPAQFQFFSISSGDPSQIVFAAQKEAGNAQICYKWSGWKLYRHEKNDKDGIPSGNWFTRSGQTAWISDMAGSAVNNDYCLAENVLDFSVTAYKKTALNTKISTSVTTPIPDVIKVTMTLLSNDAHEKLRNRFPNETTDSAKDAKINTLFTTEFQYIKTDGSDSSESEKKTVMQMVIDGTPPVGGDDTTQAILYNGCQRFSCMIPIDRGQ